MPNNEIFTVSDCHMGNVGRGNMVSADAWADNDQVVMGGDFFGGDKIKHHTTTKIRIHTNKKYKKIIKLMDKGKVNKLIRILKKLKDEELIIYIEEWLLNQVTQTPIEISAERINMTLQYRVSPIIRWSEIAIRKYQVLDRVRERERASIIVPVGLGKSNFLLNN